MPRDPVSVPQQRILAFRSGGKCAYPGCGRPLVIEATQPADFDKTIGKVAHICAASPGGPRYDETMTPEQRGSVDNLIYLCGPHHDAADEQLTLHTVDFLREAKARHESKVERALRYAVGQVGFTELEAICSAIQTGNGVTANDDIEMPIQIAEKIDLNNLKKRSADLILLGLAKVAEVQGFITWKSEFTTDYGTRLVARFKQLYYQGVADGISGDDLYSAICHEALDNCGPSTNDEVQAAALAVVSYLFSTCEIFEHESPAA